MFEHDKTNVAYLNLEKSNSSNRNLRNNLNFKITAQSYLTKNKIIENAAIMWNKLENNIKAIQSRTVFKENFKKYLLSTY